MSENLFFRYNLVRQNKFIERILLSLMNILALFFDIDEFCKLFEPVWNNHLLADNTKKRNRQRRLSLSKVMTILILFHASGYRNLKQFYLEFVCQHLSQEFPKRVCYSRFVEFERDALHRVFFPRRKRRNSV